MELFQTNANISGAQSLSSLKVKAVVARKMAANNKHNDDIGDEAAEPMLYIDPT